MFYLMVYWEYFLPHVLLDSVEVVKHVYNIRAQVFRF